MTTLIFEKSSISNSSLNQEKQNMSAFNPFTAIWFAKENNFNILFSHLLVHGKCAPWYFQYVELCIYLPVVCSIRLPSDSSLYSSVSHISYSWDGQARQFYGWNGVTTALIWLDSIQVKNDWGCSSLFYSKNEKTLIFSFTFFS